MFLTRNSRGELCCPLQDNAVYPSPVVDGYRNKVQYTIGRGTSAVAASPLPVAGVLVT
jgi:hypothetical protein